MNTSRTLEATIRLSICIAALSLNQQIASSLEPSDETPKISSRRKDADRKGQETDGLFRSRKRQFSVRLPKGWSVEAPIHPDVFAKFWRNGKSSRKAVITVEEIKNFFNANEKWPQESQSLFERMRRKFSKSRMDFISGGTEQHQTGVCVWMTTKMTAPVPLLAAHWYFRRGTSLFRFSLGTQVDPEWFEENLSIATDTVTSLKFLSEAAPLDAPKASDLKRKIRDRAKVIAKAIISNDYDTIIEVLPKKEVEKLGGPQAAKKLFEQATTGMELFRCTVHEVSSLSQNDRRIWLAVVPTTTVGCRYRNESQVVKFKNSNPGKPLPRNLATPLVVEGYLVAMSQNRGATWEFIEGGSSFADELRRDYPTAVADVAFPVSSMIIGYSDEPKTLMRLIDVRGNFRPTRDTVDRLRELVFRAHSRVTSDSIAGVPEVTPAPEVVSKNRPEPMKDTGIPVPLPRGPEWWESEEPSPPVPTYDEPFVPEASKKTQEPSLSVFQGPAVIIIAIILAFLLGFFLRSRSAT